MSRIRDDVLQQVWRSVHAVGARAALSSERLDELRTFASDRMRELPHTVVDPEGAMRASFVDALEHAAADAARADSK